MRPYMKTRILIASGAVLAVFACVSAPANAKSLKECNAEWNQMKASNSTNGVKYADFRKQCLAEAAAPAAAPAPTPAAATPAETPPAAKPSGGRQAMYARERACGKEWRDMKAAGTRPAGEKWPQFWHECDERMKAKGM